MYRHCAYDIVTGEILSCERGKQLKRAVALTKKTNKELFDYNGKWRFCHDFGKRWNKEGLPTE